LAITTFLVVVHSSPIERTGELLPGLAADQVDEVEVSPCEPRIVRVAAVQRLGDAGAQVVGVGVMWGSASFGVPGL
jgi:hypothetical protein